MSQYYQFMLKRLNDFVEDKNNPVAPYLDKAEKLTNVKKIVIAQGVLAITGLYLIIGRSAEFVCNLIGFIYPAYKSLLALETSNKEDDSKWLTYWVVFAAFSLFEFFSDILLNWFPLYWLAKVVFLLWCSAESPLNGSTIIYNRFIRPAFLKHKGKLDAATNGSPNKKE